MLEPVSAVDRLELRSTPGLFHTQIGEGGSIRGCEARPTRIGEVRVADNPGRCEPGTGEMNHPATVRARDVMGYACLSRLAGDPEAAPGAFRAAFGPQ
ncbi:hypothetical protein [Vannielia litorea]|uniref:hypothetical protein n=1 Tax=Vannielia litorea TaxID=1217970 RepID=UPI000941854A|nr:hypothetical protein [Vannielia litorea]